MTPLVSVVIPCFRQGHLLAGAIDSALRQSYPAVEVIVVNDGSDDQTDEVARRYGSRIRYINQQNRGLAGARNAGIEVATGKYLLFLDADDLLHPDAIDWMVNATGGRENVLCSAGHRVFSDPPGVETGRDVFPPQVASPSGLLLSECFGPPNSFLSPRSKVVALGGFDPIPAGCEDYDLWVRLVLAGCEVIPVPRLAAYYRHSPGSMSTNRILMGTAYVHIHRRVFYHARKSPDDILAMGRDPRELRNELRQLIGDKLLEVAYRCRQKGQYRVALHHYLSSLFWGRPSALVGICKLLPHRLMRRALQVDAPVEKQPRPLG